MGPELRHIRPRPARLRHRRARVRPELPSGVLQGRRHGGEAVRAVHRRVAQGSEHQAHDRLRALDGRLLRLRLRPYTSRPSPTFDPRRPVGLSREARRREHQVQRSVLGPRLSLRRPAAQPALAAAGRRPLGPVGSREGAARHYEEVQLGGEGRDGDPAVHPSVQRAEPDRRVRLPLHDGRLRLGEESDDQAGARGAGRRAHHTPVRLAQLGGLVGRRSHTEGPAQQLRAVARHQPSRTSHLRRQGGRV